eukprot:TRINITY_DN1859_c1_g1_i3.p1 TRINITY_DN1859_c1_g1~~TRINITY_DN1859_c1_g1_i3.p1  ORF type:complete len:226 (-),score=39.26 TRINITY_DN1859_c1_g1_i3:315-992(-)
MFSAHSGCRFLRCLVASLITEACSVAVMAPFVPALGAGAAAAATGASVSTGAAAAGTAAAGTAAAAAGTAAAAAGTAAAGTAAAGSAAAGGAVAGFAMQAALEALPAAGIAGPLGFGLSLLVGADADAFAVTWDCWKPMVHETSSAPSRGRLLNDLLNDPAISEYHVGRESVFVRNRWNESWRIDPVILPWGQVAAHASQIESMSANSSADVFWHQQHEVADEDD